MATVFSLTAQALGLVYNILTFLGEEKGAGIVNLVKKFLDDVSKTDFDFNK